MSLLTLNWRPPRPQTKKARLPFKQASVLQPSFPSSAGALKLDVCVFNMLTSPLMVS